MKRLLIEFGCAEWQPRIGGDFSGPEDNGQIAWNWLGAEPGWLVLPELTQAFDYEFELHAVPIAVPGDGIWEISATSGSHCLARWAVPITEGQRCFSLNQEQLAQTAIGKIEFNITRLPRPAIDVSSADVPIAHLEYEYRPDIQPKTFLLRGEFVGAPAIIRFSPNYAVTPVDPSKTADPRQLSFRFIKMHITRLPR